MIEIPTGWNPLPIPDSMEGKPALVVLDEKLVAEAGREYYGEPVAVCVWLDKYKTTFQPSVVYPEWVLYWKPL